MPQHDPGAEYPCASFEYARARFLGLFKNRYSSIVRSAREDGSWRTVSQYFYLTDFQILQAIEGGSLLRGARWDTDTTYFVLDIDATSPYHTKEKLYEITYNLQKIGLEKWALFRSSRSGGWHLYVFLDRSFNSDRLSNLLRGYLRQCGFQITNGVLEVFPSGNALRFPLQAGFAFLDNDCAVTIRREELGLEDAIEEFVRVADRSVNHAEGLLQKIERQLSRHDQTLPSHDSESLNGLESSDLDLSGQQDPAMQEFEQMVADAHDQMHDERYRRGREYWLHGLTSKNQRHDALLTVGYFLWFGDPSLGMPRLAGRKNAPQRERFLRKWIEERHNGHCRHINRNKWKAIEKDIERAVHWARDQAQSVRVPYLVTERLLDRQQETLLTVDQLERANIRREQQAREKISDAVRVMKQKNEKPTQRGLARMTGCSRNTIKKHIDLWLPGGSGDLSSLGGGELPPAATVLEGSLLSLVPENSVFETGIAVVEEIVASTLIIDPDISDSESQSESTGATLVRNGSGLGVRQLRLIPSPSQKPKLLELSGSVGEGVLSNSS